MRDRGDIGIIACKSGRRFADRIMAGLEHQFSKNDADNTVRLIETEEEQIDNHIKK